MTHEAASYREDVEQLRRRFEGFAGRMRFGRGCRRNCGPPQRSWRGGMGSKLRRRRWMWIDRVFRSGRIDLNLARKPSRASLDASVSPEESPLQPPSWNCWRGPRVRRRVVW